MADMRVYYGRAQGSRHSLGAVIAYSKREAEKKFRKQHITWARKVPIKVEEGEILSKKRIAEWGRR